MALYDMFENNDPGDIPANQRYYQTDNITQAEMVICLIPGDKLHASRVPPHCPDIIRFDVIWQGVCAGQDIAAAPDVVIHQRSVCPATLPPMGQGL